METQAAALRPSLHSSLPWIQIPENHLVSLLPKIRSRTRVSLRIHSSSSQALLSKRNIQCRSSIERRDRQGVSDVEEEKPKPKLRRKNLAVFVSGGGSNFRSIYEATLDGSVHGDVVVLVTSKHDSGGAEYARDKRIPVVVFPRRKDGQDVFFDRRSCLPKSHIEHHPSLLPAFGGKGYYGMKVHKAVIASGARYSGPTIHYVDEQYDTGRILAQRVVPVLANDTAEELAARVLHEEHKLYVEVAAALCEERITWREDGVPLIRSKENPNDLF
ncbi:UNVERIFIED_CONTAM: Phosphoribosylglycinamide formyltransferase, chloroplastic [Sesamum calycinum]|uniref:phosphoribosylglycinamide formyltransferase 1 n=1 Tax=Sesamum calycinum TaxID=2727403 RepID=A0AAW2MC90_9LAMI